MFDWFSCRTWSEINDRPANEGALLRLRLLFSYLCTADEQKRLPNISWIKQIAMYVGMASTLIAAVPTIANACTLNVTSVEVEINKSKTLTVTCNAPGTVNISTNLLNATITPKQLTFTAAGSQQVTITGGMVGQDNIMMNWTLPPAPMDSLFPQPPVTVLQTPPPETPGDVEGSGEAEDPINTFTGDLYDHYAPDINLGGPMQLRFSRYYASGLKAVNIAGNMGDNWLHNFEWKKSYASGVVEFISPTGRRIQFVWVNNQYKQIGRIDIPYQLVTGPVAGNSTLANLRNNASYVFNAAGQLISVSNSVGNTHTLTYSAGGLLTQVADGLGRVLNFTYNLSNQLISVDDGAGRSVGFTYTGTNLTGVTNLLGNTATYTYATGGLMTAKTRPLGNTPYSQTYDLNSNVITQTDALGNTSTLVYNGSNTIVTDALAQPMTHTHTATGELTNVVRRDGSVLPMSYNADGQRSSITDSLGATTGFSYTAVTGYPHAANGRVDSITHANGNSTQNIYTTRTLASGLNLSDRTTIIHADGTMDFFAYADPTGIPNNTGLLSQHTDRNGVTIRYTYNANGQWLTRENPNGGGNIRTYNADGTVATSEEVISFGVGNITSFAYDAFRRLTTTTYADATTRSFTYDARDQPLTITDGRAGVATFVWDANGNMSSRTDRLGAATTYTYDAMDRISKVTDANAAFSAVTYDALGRKATKTDRNGNSSSFGYDKQSRLTSVTDGNGNAWLRTFDSEGILATTTTPLANTTTYTSNNMGRFTQIASPLGNSVQFTYDAMNRPVTITDPLGNVSSRTYDLLGRVASSTLPGGISASYLRDGLGKITQITDPNGQNWLQTVDLIGRVTDTTDPLQRSDMFYYDSRNRVSQVLYSNAATRTNTYDANGNLTRRLYSDTTDLTYTYDAEDRLLTTNGLALTRDNLGRITNSNGITMTYDAGGRITSVTYAPAKAVTYTYDANDNLKTVTDWVGGVSTFSYDADSRLTSMTRPNGVATTYSYDNDGRLVGFADGALASTTLTRDAKGQITAANRTVPTAASAASMASSANTFDTAAQVSTAGYTYDALGRLTSNGATAFTWDLASRLTAAGAAAHTYDGNGYRLSRTTAAGTRNYVWNYALGLPSVSIEKQGAADLRYYVHAPGGTLLYSIDAVGNARHFYHFDEIGNTRFVSNDTGAVQVSYAYSPFGALQASTGVLDNPFTWQGQGGLMDDGNGLYYVRARYYDASAGRFISKDPVKSTAPMMLNPYQYALNDPLRFGDVSGTEPIDDRRGDFIEGAGLLDFFLPLFTGNPKGNVIALITAVSAENDDGYDDEAQGSSCEESGEDWVGGFGGEFTLRPTNSPANECGSSSSCDNTESCESTDDGVDLGDDWAGPNANNEFADVEGIDDIDNWDDNKGEVEGTVTFNGSNNNSGYITDPASWDSSSDYFVD